MTLNLPQELLDVVVDQLQGDKHSLAACGLTSKAMLDRAHRYLFRSVTVEFKTAEEKEVQDILPLDVLSFRARCHIRSFHIYNVTSAPYFVYHLLTVISHLHSLEKLILEGVQFVEDPQTSNPPLTSPKHTVGHVRLYNATGNYPLFLSQLFAFATVHTLYINDFGLNSSDSTALVQPNASLATLRTFKCGPAGFRLLSNCTQPLGAIRSVHLTWGGGIHETAQFVFATVGEYLEEFALDFSYVFITDAPTIRLAPSPTPDQCPILRRMKLKFNCLFDADFASWGHMRHDSDYHWAQMVLSVQKAALSPSLQTMLLSVTASSSGNELAVQEMIEKLHWEGLEKALDGLAGPCRVAFSLKRATPQDIWESVARQKLSRSIASGRLSIIKTSTRSIPAWKRVKC